MSNNDVRIGVKAETQGVDAGMKRTEQSVKGISKTVDELGKSARKAAQEIDRIEVSARRLERVQKILSSEMGRSVSPVETRAFLERFESMRANRHLSGGAKLRQFGSFEEWHAGNRGMFVNPAEAERYKRHVIGMASGGIPGGGHAGGGGHGNTLMQRGMHTAKHYGGAMLGFAGITGVMEMAGRAIEKSRSEALANNELLRSVGDLHISFADMRDQVRSTTDGLNVAFTEAAEMAKHFAKEANASTKTDVYGNVRTGMGLGRAFGVNPETGVGFMAHMYHYGALKDDKNGKRTALMIAEAIERGGSRAKADEVMSAVADFTSQVAKMTLSTPNIAGFAGAMASLTAPHTPGLDPRNAASMLMTADSAMRRGGAVGEASLNLTYGALSRQYGNINPVLAMGLAEGGMFGTGASFAKSGLGKFYASRGFDMSSIAGSNTTNFELVRTELERQYGKNNPLMLNAFQRHFGLSSQAQAAALYNMKPMQLGGLASLVNSAGLDVQNISASGIQNLAEIGTSSSGQIRKLAKGMLGRSDLQKSEKDNLARLMSAAGPGADDALRTEMARLVATREQEENTGTDILKGVTSMDNMLTSIGGALLPAIATIQEAVVAMAGTMVPDSDSRARFRGMGRISEYQGKKKALEMDLDAKRAENEAWVNDAPTDRERRIREATVKRREVGYRYQAQQLESDYAESIKILQEQEEKRRKSLDYGGAVPAGNPAGPATAGAHPIQLELTGRILNQSDQPIGQMDPATTVLRPPLAAGSR